MEEQKNDFNEILNKDFKDQVANGEDSQINKFERKTFIKKNWVWVLLFIVFLVGCASIIDLEFTDGKLTTEKVTIFVDGKKVEKLSYSIEPKYPSAKQFANFLYSLAMALSIALIILKIIQEDEDKLKEDKIRQREKQQSIDHNNRMEEIDKNNKIREEQLFKNVFKGVFDRLVPDQIFKVIQSDILEAKVVRKNVQWIYDFRIEDDNLVLYRNVMYEIHNISSEECNEPFSYIYSSTDYTETKILFLKWHKDDDIDNTDVIYDVERDGEEYTKMIEKEKEILDKDAHIDCDKERIEARVLELHNTDIDFEQVTRDIKIIPGTVTNINFKSKETFKNNSNFLHETHFTTACSIGWELEVNYPKGYSFSIIPMFSANLTPTVDDIDRKKYKHKGAILKGQGIEFTLSKTS